MVTSNTDVRRYLREVRRSVPGSRKLKREIVCRIETTAADYLAKNPGAEYSELTERFGTPQQIASAYVEEMEISDLIRGLRIRERIMRITFFVVAVVVILWLGFTVLAFVNNQDSSHGYYVVSVEECENISSNLGGE